MLYTLNIHDFYLSIISYISMKMGSWAIRKKKCFHLPHTQGNKQQRSHEQVRMIYPTAAYLTIKSNSDPASMSTPSRVETAPSRTGANMCSRASTALWFLSPMAVRKACGMRRVEMIRALDLTLSSVLQTDLICLYRTSRTFLFHQGYSTGSIWAYIKMTCSWYWIIFGIDINHE